MNYKKIYEKYRDVIPYMIFGVLTTLVNMAVYWLMAHPLQLEVMPSTVTAWIITILFAYVTNRKWVFHSEASAVNEIIQDMISFFACRLATGIVDWGCMFLFVNICHFDDVIIKFAANVLVIILNYAASRLIIFKHKDE